MKINFLLLLLLIVMISSCSTAYKTGQTPDDVYYSPVRLQSDDVRKDDDRKINDNSVYTTTEDREIRRRVHSRRYRRYDDRYDYPYGSYPYGNSYPVYGNPKYGQTQNPPQPRKTSLGAYKPNTTTAADSTGTYNPKLGNQNTGTTTNPVRTFSKPATNNNGTGVGNLIRRVFTGDNGNSNNNTYQPGNSNSSPSRTFDTRSSSSNSSSNNNSSSSNSSSKSSSSAPVRTFKNDQ